jgi:hypothetical protein
MVIAIFAFAISRGDHTITISILYIIGVALLLWGCIALAKRKGYSWQTGLLGVLGCVGLVILVLLKDKSEEGFR